ncbi:hypothetical protein C8Q75DRAFT_747465 [Abortiporus biennis]|nr:hypothetical protein C8Q75DRAFT_747465 [Abortiporus biennis]
MPRTTPVQPNLLHPYYVPPRRLSKTNENPRSQSSSKTAVPNCRIVSTHRPIAAPRKLQASHPVDMYGPVPHGVVSPKKQAPNGTRYCEELGAFVPAELPYRIRGVEKTKTKMSSSISRRIARGMGKGREESVELVMVMGLTHRQMKLIPLTEARGRVDLVQHGLDLNFAAKSLVELD